VKNELRKEYTNLTPNRLSINNAMGLPGEVEYQRGIQALDNNNFREAKRYLQKACAKDHPSALVCLFELYYNN